MCTNANGALLPDLLAAEGAAPLEQRWPLLLLGGWPTPTVWPPFDVRWPPSSVCAFPTSAARGPTARTPVTSNQDSTMSPWHGQPGGGKWLTSACYAPEMKRLTMWLAEDRPGVWKPVRPAEGRLRGEWPVDHPAREDIQWDGSEERVERPAPAFTGPELDLSTVMVPGTSGAVVASRSVGSLRALPAAGIP